MTAKREVREDQHGTLTGYQYGCRCYKCSAACKAASRERREKGLSPDDALHGRPGGYARGCRCAPCTAANRDSQRKRSAATFEEVSSLSEVRLWASSLGFQLPLPKKHPARVALIARYNREHPDRPYEVPEDRP